MSQIICRRDQTGKQVVFLAESYNNGQIKVWSVANGTETVGIDYYQSTFPINENEAGPLVKKYSKAVADNNVVIRERLPRMYKQKMQTNDTQPVNKRSAAAKLRYQQEKEASESEQVEQETNSNKALDVDQIARALAEVLRPLLK